MQIVIQRPADPADDNPVPSEFTELMMRATRCKRPDTELIFNPAKGVDISDMTAVADLGSRFRNDTLILESLLQAVTPSVDGAVVHCYFDPALWPARQMLGIPVVGAAEASMNLATFVGRRFAVMTVNPRYVPAMADTIEFSGKRAQSIANRPVRAIEADEADAMRWWMEDRLDQLVDTVTTVARGCIADGADVLILGCGLVSILLTEGASVTEIDGVPIITPIAAAVKAVESLVDLQRAGVKIKSDAGYWGMR